jgi:hypothetical protein
MDELTGLLSRERRLLEVLLFKLVTARHLLAAGESRFIAWSAAEVERATERVREIEVLRAGLVQKLAREVGLSEDRLTLQALAQEAPEPYRTIFSDHRAAFFELVAEIEEVTRANRKLAQRGVRQVDEILERLDAGVRRDDNDVRLYGPAAATRAAVGPGRFDGAI